MLHGFLCAEQGPRGQRKYCLGYSVCTDRFWPLHKGSTVLGSLNCYLFLGGYWFPPKQSEGKYLGLQTWSVNVQLSVLKTMDKRPCSWHGSIMSRPQACFIAWEFTSLAFTVLISKCTKSQLQCGHSSLKLSHASYENLYRVLTIGFVFKILNWIFLFFFF